MASDNSATQRRRKVLGSTGQTRSVRRVVVQDRTPLSGEMGGTRTATTTHETRTSSTPRGTRKRPGSGFKTLAGRASGGTLLAEYLAGVLIIVLSLFTKAPYKGYTETMSEVLVRLTALTAVFFVLFLMAGSENAGKAAAWFGLLVDLGILFTATAQAQIASLVDITADRGTGIDSATLDKATSLAEPKRVQLPDE